MSFKKIVLLQMEGLIQVIVKFRTEKNLRTFLSSTGYPLWRRVQNIAIGAPSIVYQYPEKEQL